MSNPSKPDFKKIFIIGLPIIGVLLIYIFFFKETKETEPAKQASVLLIPDADAENVPKSKTEVYSQERKAQRAKDRETEESKISTSEFLNKLAGDENPESTPPISEEEKEKRLNELFTSTPSSKKSSGIKTSKKWETEEFADPLEEYDLENNKNKKKSSPRPQPHHPVPRELPKQDTAKPSNIPGQRSRDNNIAKLPDNPTGNLVPAVIHSDQTVKNGSTVKIRLLEDFYVEGKKIPKNTFVYGVTRFANERVDVVISAIRMENNIIPFNKSVFDKDGLKGLYFPENAGNEVSKEVGSDAIDEAYDIATSGGGIVGSVLSAGKSVLKRKNNERKVNLKANYKIYLK